MTIIYLLNKKTKSFEKHENINKIVAEYFSRKLELISKQDFNNIEEFRFSNIKTYDDYLKIFKETVSRETELFPLYSKQTDKIYLIPQDRIFDRVINNHYKLIEKNSSDNILDIFNYEILEERYRQEIKNGDYSKYEEITDIEKPFYVPNTGTINPYYTKSELETLYELHNIKEKEKSQSSSMKKIIKREISKRDIIKHREYIEEKKCTDLIEFYSLLGSYSLNRYLRNLDSPISNPSFDKTIIEFTKLIQDAPSFENEISVYRFVHNDSFLRDVELGTIFTDPGILSTTRDPFYHGDYSFGNILIKIKLPKNKKGAGLCIETFSHFAPEQEILLAPNSLLRIDARDEDVNYQHVIKDINIKIKTKYEMTLIPRITKEDKQEQIESLEYIFSAKEKREIKEIDILSLAENNKKLEKHEQEKRYSDLLGMTEINQFYIKNNKTKTHIIFDKINVSAPYLERHFYTKLDMGEEIVIYAIDKNKFLFFIEIKEDNGLYSMIINHGNTYKYNGSIPHDFMMFISCISIYFGTQQSTIMTGIKIKCPETNYSMSLDLYKYLKEKKIPFPPMFLDKKIIVPLFSYNKIDSYWKISAKMLLEQNTDIELEQLIEKEFSVNDLYIKIFENECYLMQNFIEALFSTFHNTQNNMSENLSMYYNVYYAFYPERFFLAL